MSNRDLLKEAIADAKTIKETAIANAKVALEEAFAPQLRSMLSAKLEEMEREDMEEGYDEKMDEAKDEMEEGYEKDMDEAQGEGFDAPRGNYDADEIPGNMLEGEKEDMDEEVDLDEILAELEEGEDKEDIDEAEEVDEAKDEMNEAEEIEEAEEDEEVEVDAEEGEDEDEEIDLEEMSEEDLKSFIEDVIADMVEAGELEAGEEFDAEEDMEDMDGEEEIEIEDESEEIMEGEKEEVDEVVVNEEEVEEGVIDKLKKVYNDKELLSKIITVDGEKVSIKDLLSLAGSGAAAGQAKSGSGKTSSIGEAEMEDMMEEVNQLKAELHEVNLLNAKLLYSNKIFRAKNLKEAQKVKVLEAFDKAETVKEVKLVFETLTEEVKETKTVVKENLGSASKAVGMIAETKVPIVDVNPQVVRWQKLAGIK